jgi:kynurenine formamidase
MRARQASWWLGVLLLAGLAGCRPSPEPPGAGTPPGSIASALSALATGQAIRLVDLTHPLGPDSLYWPSGGPFEHRRLSWGPTQDGYWYAAGEFQSPEHLGTHLDAPIHFSASGWTAADIPVERFIAAGCVIDVRARSDADPDALVEPADLTAWEALHGQIPRRGIVLIRTGWSARWPDWNRYYGSATPKDVSTLHFPGVSERAAGELVRRGVSGVGIDTASIDPGVSRRFETHQVLAGANVFALENLTGLDDLPPAGFLVVALPMKIAGGTGGPTRVVAIVP